MKEIGIAIIPGSFDPITEGHVALVKQALERYDKVYLAVMINPSKKYMFSLEERKEIAKAALAEWERVEVISSEGMLWQLTLELDATCIVKGYRNEQDLAYEQEMAAFNFAHNPKARTELLPSPEEWKHISSTVVRTRIKQGLSLQGYLPSAAIAVLQKILAKKKDH